MSKKNKVKKEEKLTVADYCSGCTFDLHYCLDSFDNKVTERIRTCSLNRFNRENKTNDKEDENTTEET